MFPYAGLQTIFLFRKDINKFSDQVTIWVDRPNNRCYMKIALKIAQQPEKDFSANLIYPFLLRSARKVYISHKPIKATSESDVSA